MTALEFNACHAFADRLSNRGGAKTSRQHGRCEPILLYSSAKIAIVLLKALSSGLHLPKRQLE